MKIRLGNIELSRGLALRESPTRFSLASRREIQVARTVRAAEGRVFDRGNAQTVVTFTITRRHDCAERALRFAATHPAQLAATSDGLVLTSEDGPVAAELYLPHAVLHRLHCEPAGLVTHTEYEFIGGALTNQPTAS